MNTNNTGKKAEQKKNSHSFPLGMENGTKALEESGSFIQC